MPSIADADASEHTHSPLKKHHSPPPSGKKQKPNATHIPTRKIALHQFPRASWPRQRCFGGAVLHDSWSTLFYQIMNPKVGTIITSPVKFCKWANRAIQVRRINRRIRHVHHPTYAYCADGNGLFHLIARGSPNGRYLLTVLAKVPLLRQD